VHVDDTEASRRVFTRYGDRVRIANQADVRQVVRSRHRENALRSSDGIVETGGAEMAELPFMVLFLFLDSVGLD
jgi:hypothetical protein